jgi:hypothetical protein
MPEALPAIPCPVAREAWKVGVFQILEVLISMDDTS